MFKKIFSLTVLTFLLSNIFMGLGNTLPQAYGDELDITNTIRYSGSTRYETAVEISSKNWTESDSVVLARGDDFPDALVGSVLANSSAVKGPLLLTETNKLRPEVLAEIQRLNPTTVYILGGTGAVSAGVENALKANNLQVVRLQGADRYETAARIVTSSMETNTKAFLASGDSFADALSISSYAASKGIPLLLTKSGQVPQVTLDTLKKLGVTEITLIGGEGVITPSVKKQLEKENYSVSRLGGKDRFGTNTAIISGLEFNLDQVIVATGMAFPDALAGSALAARDNHPVLLVPQHVDRLPGSPTDSFLAKNREVVKSFKIAGGSGAVTYAIEAYIRNGNASSRISLQFWDGYGNESTYKRILSYVPGNLTDHIDILVPNFTGELKDDGSFGYSFASSAKPKELVTLGKSKGAKVVPMILASGKTATEMLLDESKRTAFADSAVRMVQETDADGILIDLENLGNTTGPGLTGLMQDIYRRLNPQGKMVLMSVMSKTSRAAEPWYAEYDYRELAKYTDYIQIMTYDKHWPASEPGPVAPLDWVQDVLEYAVTEIPSEKILMGMPYFGYTWRKTGNDTYLADSFGLAGATETAQKYNAQITREKSAADPVGIPTFSYKDDQGFERTAYFDDRLSWDAKLSLVDKYNLGGVGGWAMGWVNEVSTSELYPLLRDRI